MLLGGAIYGTALNFVSLVIIISCSFASFRPSLVDLMHPPSLDILFIHSSSVYDNSVDVDSPSMNCVIRNVEVDVDRFVLQAWKSGNGHRFG